MIERWEDRQRQPAICLTFFQHLINNLEVRWVFDITNRVVGKGAERKTFNEWICLIF